MKKIITVLCLLSTFTYSQTWLWTKSGAANEGKAICRDDMGNCYSLADSSGESKIFKYSPSGLLIWTKYLFWSANNIVSDNVGFLYIIGDSLAKYDATGNLIWLRGTVSSKCISMDGAGFLYTTGANTLLAKYDPSGNQIWSRNVIATGNSISTDSAGNSSITGYFTGTVSFGSFTLTSSGTKDIFVARYDSAGMCVWAKRAGGNFDCCYSNDCGYAITLDLSGNTYVTGSFVDTSDFDSFTLVGNANDIFLAKYNTNGNVVWVRQATGGSDQEGRCIALDPVGNILIGGSYVPTVDFDGNAFSGWGNYDAFVAKYDNNGNFIHAVTAGGSAWNESVNGICTDNSGNAFVTGSFYNTAYFGGDTLNSSPGGYDAFTSKIASITGVEEKADNQIGWKIYPNPATDQLTIEFNSDNTGNTSIEIKSTLGQTIYHLDKNVTKGKSELEISINDLPKGVYIISLSDGKTVLSKKLIRY
jgi:hypothetical protein